MGICPFTDKPCDLPYIEGGEIAQYYYSFRSYYFPMRRGRGLSYSCMAGYTTEAGAQTGRITCTAGGWSPAPRCHSELALLTASSLHRGLLEHRRAGAAGQDGWKE